MKLLEPIVSEILALSGLFVIWPDVSADAVAVGSEPLPVAGCFLVAAARGDEDGERGQHERE